MPIEERRYSPAEIRQVLQRAQRADAAEAGTEEGLTQAELLETAREVGFSPEQIGAALVRYEEDRQIERAQAELQQLSRRRFGTHLIFFMLLNGIMAAGNLALGPPLWFLAPLLVWGTLLLFHLRGVLLPDPDRLRRRAQDRLAQRRLKESTRHFGAALSQGASRLLSATARKIEEKSGRLGKP